jgi:hypothetical protein
MQCKTWITRPMPQMNPEPYVVLWDCYMELLESTAFYFKTFVVVEVAKVRRMVKLRKHACAEQTIQFTGHFIQLVPLLGD